MTSYEALPISLVIVSDFEDGPKTWADEDECLRRCMTDPAGVPSHVVIAASEADRETPPPDWSAYPAEIDIIYVDSTASGVLKNAAIPHTRHDLVAVVEADCDAQPGWLAGLYNTYLEDTSVDVVSGRTLYDPTSAMRRVAALYDRGYLEERLFDGSAKHISNNGALYKRDFLERYPYDDDESPFTSAAKRQALAQREGARYALAPDAIQHHAYGGLPFIMDVRRNKGLQWQQMMQHLSGHPPKGLTKPWWIIRMVLGGLRADCRLLTRSFSNYCKPVDLPLALVFPFFIRFPEIHGALYAQNGHTSIPDTHYR